MLIGGWHDGYPNPPLRVYREIKAPKKLLIGPWSHTYPDYTHCGPRINIYFKLLRWWDYWLKDMDNGIPEEPPVQIYEQEYEPPITDRTMIAGRWRMADDLPHDAPHIFHLCGDQATDRPADEFGSSSVSYLPAASRSGGIWDAGVPFTLPGEQSEDSANAINSTTDPLDSDLPIFGNPTFSLYISADVEVMPVAVRLLEVVPDGTSALVTKGILNSTRREGMDNPKPLTQGQITKVEYHLEATAWRFSRGSRIRISINGSDFPNVWPTPYAGRLTLHWGPNHPSQITLPVWGGGREQAFEFLPSPREPRDTGSGTSPWQVIHDVLEDRYRLVLFQGEGEMGVSHRNPSHAWVASKKKMSVRWPGYDIRSEATGSLTSDENSLTMNLALNVYLNDSLYFQKHWSSTVLRRLL